MLRVVYIAPHYEVFIGDQVDQLRPMLQEATKLMPVPRFLFVASIPIVGSRFSFLGWARASLAKRSKGNGVTAVPYLTMPLKMLSNITPMLVSKAIDSTVRKMDISPDIVHSHFIWNGLSALRLRERFKCRVVVTAHGSDIYDALARAGEPRSIAQKVIGGSDGIITVSKHNRRLLHELGAPVEKVEVIPNGYRADLFSPSSQEGARRTLGLPSDAKVLVSIGNLETVKGHYFLLKAMANVKRHNEKALLALVGDGSQRLLLQRTARELGLDGSVLFAGRREHEEVPLWINASDLVVLPSLREGFPTIVPESLACGKPIVASNLPGVSEAISPQNGVLVGPGDELQLASAIVDSLDKPWQHDQIVEGSRGYSWDALASRIMKFYEKVMEMRVRTGA